MMKHDEKIYEFLQDERFEVREDGTVWQYFKKYGWKQVALGTNGRYFKIHYRGSNLRVNRIVYARFNEHLDPNLVVDHKDNDPLNNHPENLQQISFTQNVRRGNRTKLTEDEVREIRQLLEQKVPQRRIAEQFGICQAAVSCINREKYWKMEE